VINEYLRRILFLPEQASTFALRADRLHYLIICVTMLAAAAIFLTAFTFIIRYRRRKAGELTPRFVAPPALEGTFVVVSLGFFLLCFFIGFRDYIWVQTPPENAMDVYVTAKQWMWKFSYPDGPNSLDTLRVPVGQPVRLLITSRDVIHSFFVPDFRMKQDAVPGRYTQIWFQVERAGTYQVLCAEYCGLMHSNMRAEVVAMEPADFQAWRAEQRRGMATRQDIPAGAEAATASLRELGQRMAAEKGCLKCHSVDGTPHIGPTWLDLYGRAEKLTTGASVVADEAYLTESMMDPAVKVVAGFNPVMPSYFGKLAPAETSALIEYIKTLRSPRLPTTPSQEPVYGPLK
jgi:cytochrome c oxidase subunit II